jgi:hypothetical protein
MSESKVESWIRRFHTSQGDNIGLKLMEVIGDGWVETVRQFGRGFKAAVGRPNSLTNCVGDG